MQGTDKAKRVSVSPDQSKRRTLQRLALGAVAAPLVASVAMQGLTISKVHAGTASSSSVKQDGKNSGGKNSGGKNGGNEGGNFGGKNGGNAGGNSGGPPEF